MWGLLPAFSRCSVGVVPHVDVFLMYLWGRRWSPLDTCLPSWRCLRKFIADDLIIWGARTPPQWLPSPAVQYPSWWPQPSPPSNWHEQLTSRPILLSLFTLMVKLSQIWPVVACSRWLLCLCDLSVLFCEHFLTSWNSKLFQTHLILSLWKPRNESFFQEALTPLSEECYLFIYFIIIFIFWLRWVFVAAWRLSLVVVSRGYSLLRCMGFSLRWLLLLRSMGSWCAGLSSCGSQALEEGLSSCGAQAQ